MKRGHAEALMPLIARVMAASGVAFAALDRIAVTTGPGSFTGLRVGLSAARGIALAADKPVVGLTTLTAYAAPFVAENGEYPIVSAIDARHDHVYFQVVSGNGNPLIQAEAGIDRGSRRHHAFAFAASGWQRRKNSRRPLAGAAPPPFKVDPQPAPDITWVAWVGAAVSPQSAPAKPYYLRAPGCQAAERSAARQRAADRLMIACSPAVERRHRRGRTGSLRDAARSRNCMRLVSPRLGEGEFEQDADRAQHAGSSSPAGRRSSALRSRAWPPTSRDIVDRDRFGSTRPRPVARPPADAFRPSGRPGIRRIFLEVEENNQPARRCMNAPDLPSSGAVSAITSSPRGTFERPSDAAATCVTSAQWQNSPELPPKGCLQAGHHDPMNPRPR